ncbi:MAG: 23S rRNA (pseudouridine(1915)-N(3))-methyltransferase RlmH, partial [Saprospiraceae bacterium]|nr:23S rRNA (pseudouridine(1915)-N(3))-methyltransferase RlmH [Saprospiraceae bacterium]
MRIKIYCIGKTNEAYLEKGINEYLKRLKHYTNIEYEEIKDIKSIH